VNYCPHLGLVDDRGVVHGTPHGKNRCYAVRPADAPDFGYQAQWCLTDAHVRCPRYWPADYAKAPSPPPSLPKFAQVEAEKFDYAQGGGQGREGDEVRGGGQGPGTGEVPGTSKRVVTHAREGDRKVRPNARDDSSPFRQWLPLVVWGVVAVVVAAAVMVYFADVRAARRVAPAAVAGPSATPLQGSAQDASATPEGAGDAPSPSATPLQGSAQDASSNGAGDAQAPSATPLAGDAQAPFGDAQDAPSNGTGRTVALGAREGEAGWWTGGDDRGNHLGDSFLYAGYAGGQPFIAAARISLSGVARGAPIRAGEVRLTGLDAARFDPNAGGTWSVQLLADATFPDLARTDFQTLFNAPAAVSLFPTFFAADLGVGEVNVAVLDEAAAAWLEAQLIDGATSVILRITGPAGGSDSLFAWDSGSGARTVGEGPSLVLDMGPAPTHTPPLPTEAVRVATDTPTPENVLTAMAYAQTMTAAPPGTPAYRFVTPTPSPANLATLQARALLGGFPPIAAHTATPVNEATAAWLNMLATAEAYLTGTPTPPPAGAVTPIIITPTPVPANIMTAAANALTATAESTAAIGTPTPWGFNVIVATVTPPRFVIVNTPQPTNAATRTAIAAYATAVAQLTGTFTPFPYDAVTATPSPPR